MNRSVPIEANGIIPVSQSDVAGIPPIALSIPDFEGQAILRIFGNSTESEIGCYSAVVTNGATFSQPKYVGTVLGLFTLIALAASFATAIYGDHIPTVRTHYAHSLSVFVVFAVFHHIFYSGALSMNWPSVLVAWWSNFAWSAGMIYTESIQNSINHFIGSNKGNTTSVGAASTGASADGIGGGYQLSQIYRRSHTGILQRYTESLDGNLGVFRTRSLEKTIARRALANASEGYTWYGSPVKPGLPIPGNFSGFAGTLAEENIPASNAFMTAFLWLIILAVLVVASVIAVKWIVEGLSKFSLIRTERLAHFRANWLAYSGQAALRTCFIGFFMMMFLPLFQFTYKGSAGPTAIAALVFLIFFLGMLGVAGYACFYRLRFGHYKTVPDRIHIEKEKGLGPLPWYGAGLESHRIEKAEQKVSVGSIPCWRIKYIDEASERSEVHQDEDFIKKFGWLASRFRKTRWWFFALWLVYEFVRACFYGGAAGHPMTQVFGLLVVEIIGLIVIVTLRPFEGARLNALMVYLLGFSKVATVALSAAFDIHFNLPRITTTAIGIVIIVIQGILTIILLIAIILGAISGYMSVTRNNEDFRPRKWEGIRQRYYQHLEKAATDLPPLPPPPPEEPKGPYFNVASVRRNPKIEDEDQDFVGSVHDRIGSRGSVVTPVTAPHTARASRANSMHSQFDRLGSSSYTNVPFGARVHRASWSTRDFADYNDSQRNSRVLDNSTRNSRIWSTSDVRAKASYGSLRDGAGPQRTFTPPMYHESSLDVRKSRHGKAKEEPTLDERASEEQRESGQQSESLI